VSRLDSFIRRLQAQRACLDLACRLIEGRSGPVFELGLGNGRTYDHLREKIDAARIHVFDRQIAAHPDCIPPDSLMHLGNLDETLPRVAANLAGQVVLVHADVGSGDAVSNAALAAFVSECLPTALAPGAIVLSDQKLTLPAAKALDLPDGVQPGRYYLLQWPEMP